MGRTATVRNRIHPEPAGSAQASPVRPWHALTAADAVAALATDAQRGLTEVEAAQRLESSGPNALPERAEASSARIFLRQFASPLIYLLLLAAAGALALGHTSDAVVIAGVVILNAAIGAYQEGRAERSLRSLRELGRLTVQVVRDGQPAGIAAEAVVPGDILIVAAGDAVVADARLIECFQLHTSEAALTGESTPIEKQLAATPESTLLADRRSMLYAGTHIAAGRGRAVAVATGIGAEFGRIAELAETVEVGKTPLQIRVERLGRVAIVAAALLLVVIVTVGLARGIAWEEITMIGVSQIVGLIPEGLPVAMTIALAVAVQRMARRNAIVRRLAAVETLGATTVICTDKTGTLTRNEMTATEIRLPDGRTIDTSGNGPEDLLRDETEILNLLRAAVLCNDARPSQTSSGEGGRISGDPTELALVALARKAGVDPMQLDRGWPRVAEIPFDPMAKMMATTHRADGQTVTIVKGAPESVMSLCSTAWIAGAWVSIGPELRAAVSDAVEEMAGRALRVLAIARIADAAVTHDSGYEPLRGRMTLLGLIGQIDPPRPEATAAIAGCRTAGIRPVMVTGDHRATAVAIGTAVGLMEPGDEAVDGPELERLSDAELAQRLPNIAVFARVRPDQKLRIIDAYRQDGQVVAMTGDGVNDAPALVRADVGVAMGRGGTQVAAEASDIVISDDNFASIVAAVEEGRVAFGNIRKSILYLVATSLAEVVVLLAAMLLGYPPPFAAVQILWNNFVTEGLVTVNLIVDPAEGDELRRPPVRPDEPLFTRMMSIRLLTMTGASSLSVLGWFIYRLESGAPFVQAQTEAFTMLAVSEWFNVLSCRSETRSALSLDILRNRWLAGGLLLGNLAQAAVVYLPTLNGIFRTAPIGWQEFLQIGAVGSLVLWAEEIRKFLRRRAARNGRVSPPAQPLRR